MTVIKVYVSVVSNAIFQTFVKMLNMQDTNPLSHCLMYVKMYVCAELRLVQGGGAGTAKWQP